MKARRALCILLIELNTFIGDRADDHDEGEGALEVNFWFQHLIMNYSQQIDIVFAFCTM